MKKILLIGLIAFNVMALSVSDIKNKVRPIVEEYLGPDVAMVIWGTKKVSKREQVQLPQIPEITKDTKSTDLFDRKKEINKLSEEDQEGYNYNFVKELIRVTRLVKPDEVEVNRWMNTLDQGASREGIYRAMVLDGYYGRLENYNQNLSKEAFDFSIAFLKKFTGKNIKPESLQGMNIFSVKRIISEYCLDILDIYIQEGRMDDFYSWYAVFSSELAKEEVVWSNKMRKSQNSSAHKKWAMKVPTQYVKSEVVIKIHKILNLLQKRG